MAELSMTFRIEMPTAAAMHKLLEVLTGAAFDVATSGEERARTLAELGSVPAGCTGALDRLWGITAKVQGRTAIVLAVQCAMHDSDALDVLTTYLEEVGARSLFALVVNHQVGEYEFHVMGDRGLKPVHVTGKDHPLDRLFRDPNTALERARRAYERGAFTSHAGAGKAAPAAVGGAPCVEPTRAARERLRVRQGKAHYVYVDLEGKELSKEVFTAATEFLNDRAFVRSAERMGWQLVDPALTRLTGEVQKPAWFRDGIAAVVLRGDPSGEPPRSALIDAQGALVRSLPPSVRLTSHWLVDGVAWMTHDSGRIAATAFREERATGEGWVDLSGTFISEPKYQRAGPFSEGRAAFKRAAEHGGGSIYGWVDEQGRELATLNDCLALPAPFSAGISVVEQPLRAFDRSGELLFSKPNCQLIIGFAYGVALVHDSLTGTYSMIDTRGEPVPADYSLREQRHFHGFAAALSPAGWGVCDAQGTFWPLPAKLPKRASVHATPVPGVVEVHNEQRQSEAFYDLSGRKLWSRATRG